jgi:uncharacterized protein (TIGR02611 family)
MKDFLDRSRRVLHLTWQQMRRVIVAIVGASVLLVGIVMLLAPGPAFVVIPAGLAILAIEFVWARRLLRQVKVRAKRVARRTTRTPGQPLLVRLGIVRATQTQQA